MRSAGSTFAPDASSKGNTVRPFDDIKNELTWLVYQEYSIIDRLQEYYKTDLRMIRISKGSGMGGEAITDCTHIRFPEGSLVQSLHQGTLLAEDKDNLRWLLHELRHSDQCSNIGGRKQYANMWFRQFEWIMTKK